MEPGDSCTRDRGSPLSYPPRPHNFLTHQLLFLLLPLYTSRFLPQRSVSGEFTRACMSSRGSLVLPWAFFSVKSGRLKWRQTVCRIARCHLKHPAGLVIHATLSSPNQRLRLWPLQENRGKWERVGCHWDMTAEAQAPDTRKEGDQPKLRKLVAEMWRQSDVLLQCSNGATYVI